MRDAKRSSRFEDEREGFSSDPLSGGTNLLTLWSTVGSRPRFWNHLDQCQRQAGQWQAQSNLIAVVVVLGHYFLLTETRKQTGAAVHHVPARHIQILQLR
jgi:hypothetical protein